jgi:hypothetical protein
VFAQKRNKMTYQAMNAGTRANTVIPIGMEFDRSDCTIGCVLNKATFANTFWSLEYRPMEEKTKFHSVNPGFEFRPSDKLDHRRPLQRHQQHLLPRHADRAAGHPLAELGDQLRQHHARPAAESMSGNLDINDPNPTSAGTRPGRACPACAWTCTSAPTPPRARA